MSGNRMWTREEREYLEEKWGTVSVPHIAKTLGRTVTAVKIKAKKMGLGAVLESGDYVTFNQLVKAVTGSKSGVGYKMQSWVRERGLPIHKKRVEKRSFNVVYIDEFWEWANKYRSFLNFAKMEPMILGKEPEWVAEQRRMDQISIDPQREDPWSSAEDSRLEMLVNQRRYTAQEISKMMNRSEGAVRNRCLTLKLRARPIPGKQVKWTREELDRVADYIKKAISYEIMSKEMGRSVTSIKNIVKYIYLTYDQDKVRTLIGEGKWGEGAPVPTVRKGIYLSRTMTGIKKDLSRLAGLLKQRSEQMNDDDRKKE